MITAFCAFDRLYRLKILSGVRKVNGESRGNQIIFYIFTCKIQHFIHFHIFACENIYIFFIYILCLINIFLALYYFLYRYVTSEPITGIMGISV